LAEKANPSQTTDYSLEDAVLEVHNLQDWIFEEARTSAEIFERVHHQALEGYSSHGSDSEEVEDPRVEPADDVPMDIDLQEDSPGPASRHVWAPSQTREARRRRRNRERKKENGNAVPRKENLTLGRLEKSSEKSVATDVNVSTLKPGLKFEDGPTRIYKLSALVKRGFKVEKWDGA